MNGFDAMIRSGPSDAAISSGDSFKWRLELDEYACD